MLAALAIMGLWGATPEASAQQGNPVYVDDSPRAWELFRRARDQAKDNASEAVRLYQELLDDYGFKLVPVSEAAPDHFVAVRLRVLAQLRADDALRRRYALIETPQAQRMLQTGELRRLALTRTLTEPGLDALLHLAQADLESARFYSAIDWLREAVEHPDLGGRRAAHCWLMLGLAAHYLRDGELRETSARRLDRMADGGGAFREQLRALVAAGGAPAIRRGLSPLDRAPVTDLTELVAQAIWSVDLEASLLRRRLSDPAPGDRRKALDHRRREGDLMTAAATVAGPAVYVNQGHRIIALDRFTGRAIWPKPYATEPVPAPLGRDDHQTLDLNVVAIDGDTLVTLTGHAQATSRSGQGEVVCLEAPTGELRWKVTIDRIGGVEDHEGLFPYGAPIIAEGLVFVLARKVSPQLLTSCYLIALDISDGELRWARHICSSGGLKTRVARPFSTPAYVDGDLFIATAIGAIARLDAATGQARWLRRFDVPITSYTAQRRPWELGGPVVTAVRVVAISPDQRWIVALARETGDLLEVVGATSREGWANPRYLLGNDPWVYAIGREIRAFHLDDLSEPRWRLPDPALAADDLALPVDGRLQIRGRVQPVADALIVPTLDGVMVVDGETGRGRHRLGVKTVGNPVAADEQLILAGSDRLDAYMSFRSAERVLRQRIASTPTDPGPALSLLRLGMRVRNLDLALEAADLALRSIIAAPRGGGAAKARGELFAMLLEVDEQRIAANTEEGEALHAMIGTVAAEPHQRAEHLLAYGDWLSSRSLSRAVEAYQTILSDRILASTRRSEAGAVKPAANWATQRLGRLIQQHGERVYLPQADFARMQLRQLGGRDGPEPEELLSLAEEFPFAPAAVDAARSAARTRLDRGDRRGAAAALMDIYHLAPGRESSSRLLGPLVSLCVDGGWTAQAKAVLGHIVRAQGDIPLETPNGRRGSAGWLATLDSARPAPPLARVGDARGLAEPLAGRLVPVAPGVVTPPDGALIVDGARLRLIRTPDLEPRWSVTLDGQVPQLLRHDERGVLLWLGWDPDYPRAVLLDATDGSTKWTTPKPWDRQIDPIRNLARNRAVKDQMPNGEPFDPAQTIPLLRDDRLIMVRRTGETAAFDLASGDPVPGWEPPPRSLAQVHLARLHAYGLVLSGLERPRAGAGVDGGLPSIVVLDPESGVMLRRVRPLGRAGVTWMSIGPLGSLVVATAEGIEMLDLLSGETLWSNVSYAATGTQRGWPLADHVIVEDRAKSLRAIRLADGAVSDPFEVPRRGEWDPLDLREVVVSRGRGFVRYRQRIVRFDITGAVRGADVISDDREFRWLLPADDRLILVSKLKTEQAVLPGESRWQTRHIYRIYALSDSCKLIDDQFELPPIRQPLESAALIDGWLLLSEQAQTLAIPLPPRP